MVFSLTWLSALLLYFIAGWQLGIAIARALIIATVTTLFSRGLFRFILPADHVEAEQQRIDALITQVQRGDPPPRLGGKDSVWLFVRALIAITFAIGILVMSVVIFGNLLFGSLIVVAVFAVLLRRGRSRK